MNGPARSPRRPLRFPPTALSWPALARVNQTRIVGLISLRVDRSCLAPCARSPYATASLAAAALEVHSGADLAPRL